jgi:DNA-binding transcriptional ArsR family regulator
VLPAHVLPEEWRTGLERATIRLPGLEKATIRLPGLEKATIRLHVMGMSMDAVFKALADPIRRQLLDSLHARDGQTLNELCDGQAITRQAVTKHLAVLEEANLVVALRRGREKLHYLNAVPIHEIGERWIGKYERSRLQVLRELKQKLEGKTNEP